MGTPKEPPRMACNGSPLRTAIPLDSVPAIVGASLVACAQERPREGPEGGREPGMKNQAPIHAARGRACGHGRCGARGPARHRRDAHDHGAARQRPARPRAGGRAARHAARGHRDPRPPGRPARRGGAHRPRARHAHDAAEHGRAREHRPGRAGASRAARDRAKKDGEDELEEDAELEPGDELEGPRDRKRKGEDEPPQPGRLADAATTRPSSTRCPARRASPASPTSSSASSRSRSSCSRSTRPPASSTASTGRCSPRSTRSRPTTAAT